MPQLFGFNRKNGAPARRNGARRTSTVPAANGPLPVPYANMIDGKTAGGSTSAADEQRRIIDAAARLGLDPHSATTAALMRRGLQPTSIRRQPQGPAPLERGVIADYMTFDVNLATERLARALRRT